MGFFGGGGSAASNMVGATSSAAGTAGLVPAPAAGDNEKFLFGDATFKGFLNAPAASPFVKSTSRYYYPYMMIGRPEISSVGNFNSSNGAYFCPFLINGNATISQISFIAHSTNVNTTLELGIYQSDIATAWPLTKIAQATSANMSSTAGGTLVVTAITAAVKGLFWACIYNRTAASYDVKGHSVNNDSNNFVQQVAGTDAVSSVPRRLFVIKNSSISSNVFPTTLSSSDLDATNAGGNTPTLIVNF
jgi:hypothetical protein